MTDKFIVVSQPSLSKLEEDYVLDAVRSGWVSSQGRYIEEFEAAFAKFCGVAHAVTTSNGTTGLHLALAALGIGAGDEVIVPDLTFIATANAVAYTGATPVLVDIEPDTLCISPAAIEAAITPKTKAVIPVHLYGHPADMDSINAVAADHGLLVVEDAAEAHGAEYKGRRVGGLATCGVFSFYGNKILTTGEGGMLTMEDDALYLRAKILRDHAMNPTRRYWHDERGFNYRMTNLQAALGTAQMQRADELLKQRGGLMEWYSQSVRTSSLVRLNHTSNWAKNAYWMICLEVDWFDEEKRQKFMQALRERGIDSRPYFYPISSMSIYESKLNPVSARKSVTGINLPTYYDLSKDDVLRIGRAVNELLEEFGPS